MGKRASQRGKARQRPKRDPKPWKTECRQGCQVRICRLNGEGEGLVGWVGLLLSPSAATTQRVMRVGCPSQGRFNRPI